MAWSIYMHTFPDGKRYIGMTSQNPERRWKGWNHGYYRQTLMANAIEKFGWDNIEHRVLCTCETKAEAVRIEKDFIRYFQTNQREHGYNVQPGGDHPKGYKISEEALKRVRESGCHSGPNNSMYGKHLSPEHRAKLSASHKGKCDIKAIRRGAKKRMGEKAYNARKVAAYDLGGGLIGVYGSLADCGRANGIKTQDVYNVCNGRQKTCHGKRFAYVVE